MAKVLIKNIYVIVKGEDPSEPCADPKIFLGSRNRLYGSRRQKKKITASGLRTGVSDLKEAEKSNPGRGHR
jgi:hypothetical protein